MDNQTIIFIFFGIFLGFWIIIFILDRKYFMLRDNSIARPKPFSWSRVQMIWWIVIILTAFITAIIRTSGNLPTFNNSTLYMLGISSGTTMSAMLIDISDQANLPSTSLSQNMKGSNMILDILSDKNSINIHRFQTFLFTIIFGSWFMYQSVQHLSIAPNCNICSNPADMNACVACMTTYANQIMPVITSNNLVLMGASSGIYAALKTTENNQPATAPVTFQIPQPHTPNSQLVQQPSADPTMITQSQCDPEIAIG